MTLAKKIALSCAAGALAIGAVAALSGPSLAEILAWRIEAASGLSAKIRAATLSFSPLPQIAADGVFLVSPQGWSLSADEVHFGLPWQSLFAGRMDVTDLSLDRPVLRIVQRPPATQTANHSWLVLDGAVRVRDGLLIYDNPRREVGAEIQSIALSAAQWNDGRLALRFRGQIGGIDFGLDGALRSIPDFAAGRATFFDGTGANGEKIHARLHLAEGGLDFDDLRQSSPDGTLRGTGSFRWDGEAPRIKVNIDADRLDFGTSGVGGTLTGHSIDLKYLRLVDGAINVKAGMLGAGGVRASKIAITVKLDDGRLNSSFDSADFYAGKAQANLAIDVSRASPKESLKADFSGLQVASLLDLVGVAAIDGTVRATFDLASEGSSIKTITGDLAGMADLDLGNGTISGVSALFCAVAPFLPDIRELDKIKISDAHARFAIAAGEADTDDIRILSPVLDVSGEGSIDLAEQSLDLRFVPKLAAGTNGERPADPGATLLLRGPWGKPQVSADLNPRRALGDPLGGPMRMPS